MLTYRYLPEFLLEGLELQKDGKPFKLEDYDDIVNDWLDEGCNMLFFQLLSDKRFYR